MKKLKGFTPLERKNILTGQAPLERSPARKSNFLMGFTLIELLVVIAIISLLLGFYCPLYKELGTRQGPLYVRHI